MSIVLWLDEITAQDKDAVGRKAYTLAQAARAGFHVPYGFCLTTASYQEFVAVNGLEASIDALLSGTADHEQDAALRLQQAIQTGRMGSEIREQLLAAYHNLAGSDASSRSPVAVRSSATAEDLPTASFAGQLATFLNVRDEQQLLRAILACWASLWSPRAVLYRASHVLAEQRPAIAVLVQLMVDADAAGVAFSVNPISGEEAVLVEAAFGLGETVVSGQGDVDRYAVHREEYTETQPAVIAHKLHKRVAAEQGGVSRVAVAPEMRDARVLTAEHVQEVARTVLALERHFGAAQDMEWALAGEKLYVLQSRPITTSAVSFFTDILPEDNHIWTSGFLNERFTLPVSPLGWSLIQELLEELAFRDPLRYLGLRDVGQLRITRLYRGHPYVNMFVFQTLYRVFPDALLPEDAYRYFPDGDTRLRRLVEYPRSIMDPRFLLSMARHFLRQPATWSPWHSHRVWTDFAERHEERSLELEAELRALTEVKHEPQRIWAAVCTAQRLNAQLLSLHRWSLMHADLAYSLLRRLVRTWLGQEQAANLCPLLVAGLPNKTFETDCALHDLAQVTDATVFGAAVERFLARFGHRSFHLDIYHPTFADQPGQVVALAERLRRQARPSVADHAAARSQAERAIGQALGSGPIGRLKRVLFEHVLRLAQCYTPLREEQRFHWQKTLATMRRLFLLLGQCMVEAGDLSQQNDVFFLTKSEIGTYVCRRATGGQYTALADARRQQFVRLQREFRWAPLHAYPPFLRGNRPLQPLRREGRAWFRGRGVSPGLARGRVIVVSSPAEFDRIQAGNVLVTRSVDPGWTPVFALLHGLVMEHGGQLSHGAVVAREYGLPAVAGIPGVTELLHNADVVVVDGRNGTVEVVEN